MREFNVAALGRAARAGATITIEQFLALDEETQEGLAIAYEQQRIADAIVAGLAAQGEQKAADLMAPLDGGAAAINLRLRSAAAALLASQ